MGLSSVARKHNCSDFKSNSSRETLRTRAAAATAQTGSSFICLCGTVRWCKWSEECWYVRIRFSFEVIESWNKMFGNLMAKLVFFCLHSQFFWCSNNAYLWKRFWFNSSHQQTDVVITLKPTRNSVSPRSTWHYIQNIKRFNNELAADISKLWAKICTRVLWAKS